jgi:hypothetical protein
MVKIIAIWLVVSACYASAYTKQKAQLPSLFVPVSQVSTTLAVKTVKAAPYVVQHRTALVDLKLLAAMYPQAKFNLNLLPDASFIGVVERVERRSGKRFTVAGYLEDVPHGSFTIVVEEDVAIGVIRGRTSFELFALRSAGAGVHVVYQMDQRLFPLVRCTPQQHEDCPVAAEDMQLVEATSALREDALSQATCSPPQTVFDILIVYSDVARQSALGTNAINAQCQLAVELTNEAYENSQINARMRLVYRGEVTYNENGTYGDHISHLTDSSDGVMDGVHTLRDTYRADFVSLWVDDTDPCGLSQTHGVGHCPADADNAFTVVNWVWAVFRFVLAHEVGHNQGCAHDRENAGTKEGCPFYPYSYGWRFEGDSMTQWRTIMAYPPGNLIQHFSNPDVLSDGQPTGVPISDPNEAHNARTINLRRSVCEGFRQTRFDIWVDFSYSGAQEGTFNNPYNTAAKGVQEIITGVGASELPGLWIKAGLTNETITINKAMTIRACGGSVTIGG